MTDQERLHAVTVLLDRAYAVLVAFRRGLAKLGFRKGQRLADRWLRDYRELRPRIDPTVDASLLTDEGVERFVKTILGDTPADTAAKAMVLVDDPLVRE